MLQVTDFFVVPSGESIAYCVSMHLAGEELLYVW
jgi:hypothetical protein